MLEFTPVYTCTRRVLPQDCDFTAHMRPAALLACTQQVGTDHCLSFGLDSEVYARTHTAFLLAKQALEFYRVPAVNETLTFVSRPEGARRAVYKRVHEVMDESGAVVARVDSRWVLVDTETRRILRRPPEELGTLWPDPVEEALDQTIHKAAELGEPLEQIARYSLCDENGHLNNAQWVDVLCDALPPEVFKAGPVRRVAVNYHWEVPIGQPFTLRWGRTEGGYYFNGQREDRCCIEAELCFGEVAP